jgi:hypothetical protein
MSADWRIDNVKRLRGQSFRWKNYYAWSEGWDHDHCAACWAKFMADREDSLSRGYAVSEEYKLGLDYEWICADCFRDLADLMEWHVID